MIDFGTKNQKTGHSTIDISGEDSGYIVSHKSYAPYLNKKYWNSRNWTLTLTGLPPSKVQIQFQYIELQLSSRGQCNDYLLIPSLKRICNESKKELAVSNLHSSLQHITFLFITSQKDGKRGFWLRYEGRVFQYYFISS